MPNSINQLCNRMRQLRGDKKRKRNLENYMHPNLANMCLNEEIKAAKNNTKKQGKSKRPGAKRTKTAVMNGLTQEFEKMLK
tara:strand:- start:14 stop:256 length:243 start_codon:yes stop_codon:yes gene_type:complete